MGQSERARGVREHPPYSPYDNVEAKAYPAHARDRRTPRSSGGVLGARQVGRAAAGEKDRHQPAAPADEHGRGSWRRIGTRGITCARWRSSTRSCSTCSALGVRRSSRGRPSDGIAARALHRRDRGSRLRPRLPRRHPPGSSPSTLPPARADRHRAGLPTAGSKRARRSSDEGPAPREARQAGDSPGPLPSRTQPLQRPE